MTCVLAGIAVVASAFALGPVFRRRPDDELALTVEDRCPALGHRLISAVQFHDHDADLRGMSRELIEQTTREANTAVRGIRFEALADHAPLQRACWIALGVVAVVAVSAALAPQTLAALVARQLLLDRPIPRANAIANRTAPIQPAAEPITLRLHIDGPEPTHGEIRIATETGLPERIHPVMKLVDGLWSISHSAPPGDFRFEAWVGDARMTSPGHVRLVARPAVTRLTASVSLPAWCGLTPAGRRYNLDQPRGEVTGIAESLVRVAIQTQKPVTIAELDLLGVAEPGQPPSVTRTLKPVAGQGDEWTFEFDLRDDEAGYRVRVVDEHGFANLDPPRREVRLVAEEPPMVGLLLESFRPDGWSGSAEDFEAEGVPVPLGGPIRIGYTCQHPYGLGRATLVYRINEGDWRRLGLSESTASDATGPFDPKRGCFEKSRPADQIQFAVTPSADPERVPGRLEGGGRFDFQTRSLPGVKVGDQIEYFIEVGSRHPDRPLLGRSETRMKRVVTVAELVEWIEATLRQEDRIRRLTDRQRGVFDPKANPNP